MMSNEDKAGCVIALCALPVLIVARTWVLVKLWGWYLIPLGAPEITMPLAWGISITLGLFHPSNSFKPEGDDGLERSIYILIHGVLYVGLALVFGWLGTLFLP